jgi:hypothetical protein
MSGSIADAGVRLLAPALRPFIRQYAGFCVSGLPSGANGMPLPGVPQERGSSSRSHFYKTTNLEVATMGPMTLNLGNLNRAPLPDHTITMHKGGSLPH